MLKSLLKPLFIQIMILYLHKVVHKTGFTMTIKDISSIQPQLEKIPLHTLSSFAVKREITPYMDYPLHYHPEFEIIYVQKSFGLRLMGNHIGNFNDGDLVFISPNLPHVWKNDLAFYSGDEKLKVDVFVIHFLESDFGENFFNLPEFFHIKKLFALGQRGLMIKGQEKKLISELIKNVYFSSGFTRFLFFLKTLDAIACAFHFKLLASPGYTNLTKTSDAEKIDKIIDFCLKNYPNEVKLDDVASIASLSKSSFCRYFKSKTKKTFSHFLNEIRISKACKLLVTQKMNISEVCYEVGFNNMSHFTRQFKLITGLTATEYLKKYIRYSNLEST